jgi:enamine deaminase RidA (YjgF/YER057c/UK114 family)
VSVTVYLKDMQNFKRLNDIYKTYFNRPGEIGRLPMGTYFINS